MQRKAYAKINLTLEVLGNREDGYHEVATILQAVSLADQLSFESAPTLTLVGDDAGVAAEQNLIIRAARLLQQETGTAQGARITAQKEIPLAAGLGGGSSDAAVTLLALNELWHCKLTVERLAALAAQLGSDVPFFLIGGTALGTGRGEQITSLPDLAPTWLVMTTPAIALEHKTAHLYGTLESSLYTRGEHTQALRQALQHRLPLRDSLLHNVFESLAEGVFPNLAAARTRLATLAGRRVHLTGSGPTFFALADNEQGAQALQEKWGAQGFPTRVVQSVGRSL